MGPGRDPGAGAARTLIPDGPLQRRPRLKRPQRKNRMQPPAALRNRDRRAVSLLKRSDKARSQVHRKKGRIASHGHHITRRGVSLSRPGEPGENAGERPFARQISISDHWQAKGGEPVRIAVCVDGEGLHLRRRARDGVGDQGTSGQRNKRLVPAAEAPAASAGQNDADDLNRAARRRQRSIRRGISVTKLQGLWRLSSSNRMILSQPSFTAPFEPGSANKNVPPATPAVARDCKVETPTLS